MNASAKRSGIDIRIVILGVLVLLLAFGGAAAWAYTTNSDLEKTRQTLSTTNVELDSTKQSLAETEAKLATAKGEVASEQETIESDKSRIEVLEFQIDRKGACIKAQTDNLTEIRRILALERENFNRTTSGSVWAKANAASNKALDLAISYLAKSYTSAAAGNYSTANSWLSKSNAQVAASNKQIKSGNKEIDAMNAASDAINKANDDFAATLDKTTSTCGG
jgi:septal ring factor EnvC (AmiA/AmiB activator)